MAKSVGGRHNTPFGLKNPRHSKSSKVDPGKGDISSCPISRETSIVGALITSGEMDLLAKCVSSVVGDPLVMIGVQSREQLAGWRAGLRALIPEWEESLGQ